MKIINGIISKKYSPINYEALRKNPISKEALRKKMEMIKNV